MPRLSSYDRFHSSNNNNNNSSASSPSTSTSNSRGSSAQPQPLPLPELSTLLRRDGYAASCRLPSPKEPPTRFTESGRYTDFKIGGLNQGIQHKMERNSRQPSRKAPQNLKFVDVESNRFSLPHRSAPASPYCSPSLSPQRRSTGEMFSSYYTSTTPHRNQIWSAPEMPFSDGYTGFSSPASPEQNKCSPDSFRPHGSYNYHSPYTRSPQHDPKYSSRSASPLPKKAICDASISPQANSYTNVHPLPLPPGASSPPSTAAPLPAPSSTLPTPSAPSPAQSAALPTPASPLPQVPIWPEFSSANNWQKGKLIGRGTFGSVYVATNLQTGALCAMKEVELIPDDPKSAECMKQLEQANKIAQSTSASKHSAVLWQPNCR
uniref:mitogen-activated protein kinase kinase kinase n=1 Tax=Kalanchoe fedtschenkoi TaxID=63787 RepID=A0A7N0T9Q6_KALFE